MGFLLKGSNNKAAEVNNLGQVVTDAMVVPAFVEAANRGDAYAWTGVNEVLAAGGTALCVINQSRERLLCITKAYCWADVPTIIKYHVPIPCTWDGTETVGVPVNRINIKAADAVAYANESGTTFTEANVVLSQYTNELTTDVFGTSWDFEGGIVLGYDDAIACDVIANSGAFNCTIHGYYIDA